jgi:hypothetical protein
MSDDIKDFYNDFFQDISASADSDGNFLETSFIELYCNYLTEAGEFDTCDIAQYRGLFGKNQLRIDGYSGDPQENDGVLSIFISDFNHGKDILSINQKELETIFKKLENFYLRAQDPKFIYDLEESSEGFGIAEMICNRSKNISKVKLYILSNRVLSVRVKAIEEKTINNVPFIYNVWDLSRLQRMVLSGKGKEDMDIDLIEQYQQSIPCLPAYLDNNKFETYLAVVPGELLASIYDKWGVRLLEQNVRCFLQARSNVNKGIRNTILNEPEMFLAYNNGITATAESVDIIQENGQKVIKAIKNLQIVNGGQTTASIFSSRKKDKADLSAIFVQMKLSIIPTEKTVEVVPKISEFANSQNKVNAADFFANHPYHIRIEEFSRRVWAPSVDGGLKETKWFYERARGQYLDEQAYKTASEKNKYKLEYPRPQLFSKTDLAKYENVWQQVPYIVNKGAQFNFSQFAKKIGSLWEKKKDSYNEFYYKELISKAIIFKQFERLVSNLDWYKADPGYRANIVAYSISWLSFYIEQKGMVFNFTKVWNKQTISPTTQEVLSKVSKMIRARLVNTPPGISNVTEWAKKPGCWEAIKVLEINITESFDEDLISNSEKNYQKKGALKTQKIDNDIIAQKEVIDLGADMWKKVAQKGIEEKLLSDKEMRLLQSAVLIPKKIPSGADSILLLKTLNKIYP